MLNKLKELWKRFWRAVMVLLVSLSVIFSAFGSDQQARPTRRREDVEVSEVIYEPEVGID